MRAAFGGIPMRLYFARILTMLTMCSHMHIRFLDIEALISFVAIELSPYWAAVPVTALLNKDYCDSKSFLLSHAFKVITGQVVQWAFIHTSFCVLPEYRFACLSVHPSIQSPHPPVHPHCCMVIHPSICPSVKQIRLTPALSVLAKFHQSIITSEWNVVIAILWK